MFPRPSPPPFALFLFCVQDLIASDYFGPNSRFGDGGSSVADDEGSLVNLTSRGGRGASTVQQAMNEKQNA
jgi:hypothetical protein